MTAASRLFPRLPALLSKWRSRRRVGKLLRPRRYPSRLRKTTPLVLQLEATECGAASLGVILAHFNRRVPISELREACAVGRDGCDAADLMRAARKYGLQVQGWKKEPHQIPQMPLPAIIFWEFNHFLVLEGYGRGCYYLNDPGNGRRVVDESEFDRGFTGVMLTFEPGPDFKTGGMREGILHRIWPWLRDVKRPLAFAVGCGLLLMLPALALPLLLNAFIDYVLSGRAPSWGGILIGALLVAAGSMYLLSWLRARCLNFLAVRLSVVHSDRFLQRLLRVPMKYFAHRFVGDLTARMMSIDKISSIATGQFVGIAIELVTSVLFLVMMLLYSPLMCALVVALGALSAVAMRMITRLRTDENRKLQREAGLMNGVGMAGLLHIDTLQATGGEDDFFAHWSGYQARELLARQRFSELGYIIAALPGVFLIISNAVVLGIGGWQVMEGAMTVGMLMAFYVMAVNFLAPIGRFVQLADLFQTLEADLQRLDDLLDTPEEPSLRSDDDDASQLRAPALSGRLRLGGRIELRDITFGYQANRPPLIENFSLTIEPGQRVAVVGASGAGKSTLSALVGGIHPPWSGEIRFDGHLRERIPRELLTRSISMVDQRIFLFAATVRENLTMWRPETPDEDVIAASRDAAIHEEIMSRVGGYDALVQERGRNFSGGQRQRLEIARALVPNPSVLIMDEATSVLDAINEMRIDDALRRRGCSCLIIAHRLSTIRDCDLIVVLDKGKEVQRGTHQSLMAEGGLYKSLMEAN